MAKKLFLVVLLTALVAASHAANLYVNVLYGNAGSHGTYTCYLYKNGYLLESKTVKNTGFAGGQAVFNVDRQAHYFAYVVRTFVENGVTITRSAMSPGRWFQWYFVSMNLDAKFS